jgi:hypothetical protein
VEEHLNLKDITTRYNYVDFTYVVEKHLNLKDITTNPDESPKLV